MSDNPDNGMAEDEGVTSHLLALLYADEGDGDTAGESSYKDAAELSDFRGVLGHFRELPDEEPPAAISNKLLALAAKHAPAEKKAEGKGLFERITDFLLPAVYHPGLASAATLVLVAGLGATLYVNGKSQVAEPMVATQAVAPQSDEAMGIVNLEERAKRAETPKEESPADLAEIASGEVAEPATAPEAEALEGALEKKANKELADDPLRFKAGAKRDRSLDGLVGGAVGGGGRANRNTPDTDSNLGAQRGPKVRKTKPTAPSPKPVTRGKRKGKGAPGAPVSTRNLNDDREVTSKDKAESRPEPTPAPAADPAPPPPPSNTTGNEAEKSRDAKRPVDRGDAEDDDDGDDASEGEESTTTAAPQEKPDESKADPAASAAALHKKAITAAKKNQCSKVKSIGQQIRKLSSSYYDRTFLNDKKLTACLAPEVKK